MNLVHWWNNNSQGLTEVLGSKKNSQCHCVHHISHMDNETTSFQDSTS
jgi:hypothetical protein